MDDGTPVEEEIVSPTEEGPASPAASPDVSGIESPNHDDNAPQSPDSDSPQSPPQEEDEEHAATEHPIFVDEEVVVKEEPLDESFEPQEAEIQDTPASPAQENLSAPASPVNDDEEEETQQVLPKKRRILDSDDESDGVDVDNVTEEVNEAGSDTESPAKKRRAIFGSDDEDSEDDEPAKDSKKKIRVVSDDEDDESPKSPTGSGDEAPNADDLVENIFGGSDDEKEDDRKSVDDDDEAPARGRKGEDGFEWDFDKMMNAKKAEKRRSRKRKNDGFDLINDDDGQVAKLVEAMKQAAKEDRQSNTMRRPALKKRKLLSTVKDMLLKIDMTEAMLDGGMMSVVSEWLAPLPDKSLPCLEIRTTLLRLLQSYRLEQGTLRQSGLGKAVMMLYKHPRENKDNRILAQKLIAEWARPIFNLSTDLGTLSRDDRLQRDYDQMPDHIKKRRESSDLLDGEDGPSTSKEGKIAELLNPGDKGYIGRARVPKPSKTDYVIRPRSNVDGEFKGAGKREMSRIDRTARDFKERTKINKVRRAVGVSIEGRRMEL
ncbi:unnamed protein product, partial [Mesorhabditis spiculigera]